MSKDSWAYQCKECGCEYLSRVISCVRCNSTLFLAVKTTSTETKITPLAELEKSALEHTLDQRGAKYGPFIDQATVAQYILEAFETGDPQNFHRMKPDQKWALINIAQKISRLLTGDPDHVDSWHDIAGYATLIEKRLLGK